MWATNSGQRDSNPFAFTPQDLAKLHDPKNVQVLRGMGGVRGLLLGLRSDAHQGLSSDESVLRGCVAMEDVLNSPLRNEAEECSPTSSQDSEELSKNPIPSSFASKQSLTGPTHRPNDDLVHSLSVLRRISTINLSARPPPFHDRRRIFSVNEIPRRKSKTLFQLMWSILQDKVLVCTA